MESRDWIEVKGKELCSVGARFWVALDFDVESVTIKNDTLIYHAIFIFTTTGGKAGLICLT